ncbi:MAG: type II toxin-antitoxin system death-on-curing family toxin [Actinomycetota bacterium]
MLQIHRMMVCDPPEVRDPVGLDAALAQPWQSAGGVDAYPTLHLKAAVLYAGIDRRQAFIDGNKRTAFFTVRLFYELAGHEFKPVDNEMYDLAEYVATAHPVDYELVAQKFAMWASPIPDPPMY